MIRAERANKSRETFEGRNWNRFHGFVAAGQLRGSVRKNIGNNREIKKGREAGFHYAEWRILRRGRTTSRMSSLVIGGGLFPLVSS